MGCYLLHKINQINFLLKEDYLSRKSWFLYSVVVGWVQNYNLPKADITHWNYKQHPSTKTGTSWLKQRKKIIFNKQHCNMGKDKQRTWQNWNLRSTLVVAWSEGNSRHRLFLLLVTVGSAYGHRNGNYSDQYDGAPPPATPVGTHLAKDHNFEPNSFWVSEKKSDFLRIWDQW